MNIEKLVADRELCEQIPADDFLDTAFCWHYTKVKMSSYRQIGYKEWVLERSTRDKIIQARKMGEHIFPAPTLQEIMAAMPYCRVYKKTTATFIAVHEKTRFAINKNGAEAALKLWMELKGVENE